MMWGRYRVSSKRFTQRKVSTPSCRSSSTQVRALLRLDLGTTSYAHTALGKILKDEETVESYKIEEKGFVVCVVNKVRFVYWRHLVMARTLC